MPRRAPRLRRLRRSVSLVPTTRGASRLAGASRAPGGSCSRVHALARVFAVPRLAARVGDQLELHPPRAEEVDPAVALGRAPAGGRPLENVDTVLAQVG